MFSFSYYFCLLIFTWTWNAKYEPEETVVFYSRKTRRTNRRTFSTLKTASLSTTANEITESMLNVSAGGAKCTCTKLTVTCHMQRINIMCWVYILICISCTCILKFNKIWFLNIRYSYVASYYVYKFEYL